MKDLVGIGKSVKTVSDAVRGAVSVLYRPRAIRNEGRARTEVAVHGIEAVAEAEAKAALIRSESEAQLAERARDRFVFEQLTQQQALESIFQKAIEYAKQKNQKGKKISDDWLYRLMLNAKEVTDKDIQEIFAKLIVEQGSATRHDVSYMTLDALRLFEPRHATYFEVFCQLYYLFGAVHFGMNDKKSGKWIGDEEFHELGELAMVSFSSVDDRKLRFRDFSMEIFPNRNGYGFQFIFGECGRLSLRGIELSKTLFREVADHYWHGLRKKLSKREYEQAMARFLPPATQYECFIQLISLVVDENDCTLTISVYPWGRELSSEAKVAAQFDGQWHVRSQTGGYVPPYLARFLREKSSQG